MCGNPGAVGQSQTGIPSVKSAPTLSPRLWGLFPEIPLAHNIPGRGWGALNLAAMTGRWPRGSLGLCTPTPPLPGSAEARGKDQDPHGEILHRINPTFSALFRKPMGVSPCLKMGLIFFPQEISKEYSIGEKFSPSIPLIFFPPLVWSELMPCAFVAGKMGAAKQCSGQSCCLWSPWKGSVYSSLWSPGGGPFSRVKYVQFCWYRQKKEKKKS